MATIRSEQCDDVPAIRDVLLAAFERSVEADLVDRLRDHGKAVVSLVAERNGEVVGHVLFSPMTIDGPDCTSHGVGLAPLAVHPAHQRQGVGTQLTEAGIAACREAGYGFIIVLGHPSYYPRFGFRRGSEFQITNEYDVDEPFMVMELISGALPANGGLAKYADEFADLE